MCVGGGEKAETWSELCIRMKTGKIVSVCGFCSAKMVFMAR